MKSAIKALLCAVTLLVPLSANAQQFPSRPVTIVVPFPPGASNDIFGRFLAEGLSKTWKQPVTVENRPGAGGSIGAAQVVKSKPDGYTLMFSSSSYTINSAVQGSMPFDPVKDLKPVALSMRGQMIMVTGSRVPLPNVAEVIKQAKAQKLFYGGNGASSTTFAAELFNSVTGVKLELVNYKGGPDALIDLIGGRIDAYFGTVTTVLPHLANKTVTAVAVTSKTRSNALPDVPTIGEAGYPAAETDIWWGVFAPAGTPPDILARIHADVTAVVNTPEAVAYLDKQAAIPGNTSLEEFSATVANELVKWKQLAKENNIVAQ